MLSWSKGMLNGNTMAVKVRLRTVREGTMRVNLSDWEAIYSIVNTSIRTETYRSINVMNNRSMNR